MNHDDRELIRQNVEGEVTSGRPELPPPTDAPDAAETMRLLDRVSRLPDIRFDKVQRMRERIAEGKFETPERIDGAIDRLLEELGH